jgi:hypothetical protein
MIHPCTCTNYNGGQCYNCLNGAHDICEARPKCGKARDKQVGLPIVVKNSAEPVVRDYIEVKADVFQIVRNFQDNLSPTMLVKKLYTEVPECDKDHSLLARILLDLMQQQERSS